MTVPVVAEGHDEQLGAGQHPLDLEPHELLGALAQRVGRPDPLGLDETVDAVPQRGVDDPDEPPRLHETHARRLVGGGQQAVQDVVGHRPAGEVAHVATLGDRPVDGRAIGLRERVADHEACAYCVAVRDTLRAYAPLRLYVSTARDHPSDALRSSPASHR